MSTNQVRVERRAAQRFDYTLPVSIRVANGEREGCGFTQDLSARGIFFYTDIALAVGEAVELTLVMPSEITLGESMRVRCSGTVIRLNQLAMGSKTGVGVHFQGYEYLPDAPSVTEVSRQYGRTRVDHESAPEEEVSIAVRSALSRTSLV